MTDLTKLKVSLTKHNAHKLAALINKYDADQILSRLDEVHAEKAQARKNLSVQSGDIVPEVWQKARILGEDAVDALLLVGIIFSHHALINAMKHADSRYSFTGRIERGKDLVGKEYSNFARIFDQLGYAVSPDRTGFTFDLRHMFEIIGLGPLVRDLLQLKVISAHWDRSNTLLEEISALEFHLVFGISEAELREWLSSNVLPSAVLPVLLPKDQEFFQSEVEENPLKPFVFTPGHEKREVVPVSRTASPKTKANRLHNDLQNRIYRHLCETLGEENVGTENDTGTGTCIDVVSKGDGSVTFYEIKTSPSVRTNIRQAIPQLLEYAFWPEEKRANHLVIVSHLPITKVAAAYLNNLRKLFGIPISYQQFSMEKDRLL
jgi:hypothetical protein